MWEKAIAVEVITQEAMSEEAIEVEVIVLTIGTIVDVIAVELKRRWL